MIKHIVFFGLAENAEGKTKAENAAIIKTKLVNSWMNLALPCICRSVTSSAAVASAR